MDLKANWAQTIMGILLCNLLFDRIEASSGRVVVVSSLGYKMGIKRIQFDDMNWDKNYHQNKTYCHSKLAQMMFAYALQDKIAAAGLTTQALCVPSWGLSDVIDRNKCQSDFQNHVRDLWPASHRTIRNARGLSPTDVRH